MTPHFPGYIALAMIGAGLTALLLSILNLDWVLAVFGGALALLGWLWAALIVGARADALGERHD